MKLLFDQNDLTDAIRLRDARFKWLDDLGAEEISDVPRDVGGFLFGYEKGAAHYERLLSDRPNVRDRPEERQELICLVEILHRLEQTRVEVPTPKTWVIGVDDRIPDDLRFPLFLRTPKSSWKRGGAQSRVNNRKELSEEMGLLRRAFGWDVPILARKWIDVAVAGKWMFGNAPQEVRVWIVDQRPKAWSFHYLHAVPAPDGFPPQASDLALLSTWAAKVGSVFRSRLVCADFVRDRKRRWHLLEAGPGAVSGTAHEAVFKFVASALRGTSTALQDDAVGGAL